MSEFGHEERVVAPHFDSQFYKDSYPDIPPTVTDYLLHFMRIGWIEGRNPCRSFDTVGYLIDHPDVAAFGMNPFYHYLEHGKAEGRQVRPGYCPSERLALLGVSAAIDWVDLLTPHVDIGFYQRLGGLSDRPDVNPVAHFAFCGWRLGYRPAPDVEVETSLIRQSQAVNLLVNPVLADLLESSGLLLVEPEEDLPLFASSEEEDQVVFQPDNEAAEDTIIEFADNWSGNPDTEDYLDDASETPVAEPAPSAQHSFDDPHIRQVVANGFDANYYLAVYPDIAQAGGDPLSHFLSVGWREGRNPNRDFDTKYYLAINQDIADGDLNPFWHYLVAGKQEGRMPQRPGGYKREIIDQARTLRERSKDYVIAQVTPEPAEDLAASIAPLLMAGEGFVLSISHDHYITVTGGTQIFIADEQAAFARRNIAYLHLSPARPTLTLVEREPVFLANVVVDGHALGCIDMRVFIQALAKRKGLAAKCQALVVHSLLGFAVDDVAALAEMLKPRHRYFWLHDYSSLCPGYNLLRNDVTFCGVPDADSMACLVCVHGAERAAHLKAVRRLFTRCQFDILAPSEYTLDLWRQKAGDLPVGRAIAHPHWALGAAMPVRGRVVRNDGVHVAFVGYPNSSKGWPLFSEIVARFGGEGDLHFSHFAVPGTPSLPGVEFIEAKVSAENRLATAQALYKHRVDVVLVLSPWPETFSFVAYEAVAAGCQVLCLADSGNVAAMVRATGRGKVLEDDVALLTYIEQGGITELVAQAGPRTRYTIEQIGTTATVAGVVKEGEQA